MTVGPLMNVIVERGLMRYVRVRVVDAVAVVGVEGVEEDAEEVGEVVMKMVAVVIGLEILDGAVEAVDLAVTVAALLRPAVALVPSQAEVLVLRLLEDIDRRQLLEDAHLLSLQVLDPLGLRLRHLSEGQLQLVPGD